MWKSSSPHCHGKTIAGTAGGLCTPTRPARLYPAALVHTHLSPNQCLPTDTSRPFYHIPHSIGCSRKKRKKERKKNELPKKRGINSVKITPLHLRFVREENIHSEPRERYRVAGQKSSRRTANLPFDSALSPSRSSRLSPAPTAPQNITISSISSAWLPGFFLARLPVRVSWLFLGSARPGRLCPCRQLRRAASGRLRQSVRGSGASRKQPANISGVRGQRLADSNPIKHRLTQPWRRAGAGCESVEPCREGSGLNPSGGGGDNLCRK